MTRRRTPPLLPTLLAALVPLGAAPAMPAAQPAQSSAADAPAAVSRERQAAAAAAARLASLDLAAIPVLSTDDFRIAAHVLSLAHDLDPANEDILRRLMEAAQSAGDRARVAELSTDLLRLDPADTVAQLRLISARINALQNADERLARYEAFLGPRGGSIDPSVRSRLALDAALLLRERGDFNGFAERLAQAVELDPTNKEAASLATAFFSQRVDDPAGRLELLATLLAADPLDPSTHLAIARELAAAGAYNPSLRMYTLAQALRSRLGQAADPLLVGEIQLAYWHVAGPANILADMYESIVAQRQAVAAQAQRAIAQGVPPDQIPSPEQVLLQTPSAMLAAAAAAATGDAQMLDWAFNEMKLAASASVSQLENDPVGALRIAAEVLWLRLLCGRETEEAAAQLEAMRQGAQLNPDALARLEGWLLMRQGDREAAENRLRPLADRDPLALLGMAVSAEAEGDTEAAASWYAHVYHAAPGTIASAYALTRHVALRQDPPPPSDLATSMEAIAREAIPDWVERFNGDPRLFMTIEVTPRPAVVPSGGRLGVHIRIRNISSIPLAVGPGAPIDSRLLLTATADVGLDRARGMPMMEVVAADRRLRLMPQEALELTVHPELGNLWLILNMLGDKAVRLRWRVLQGFISNAEGLFVEGPMGLTAESGVQLRQPVAMAMATAEEILAAIRSPDDARLVQAAEAMGWRWGAEPSLRAMTDDEITQVALALAERYPTAGPAARIFLAATLPAGQRFAPTAPVDEAMRSERDPTVLAVVLLARATRPDDPLLDFAADSADPRLASFAALVRERLKGDGATYSRMLAQPIAAPPPSGPSR
jgi:tetratricopeptide (TPR) repeat protein